MQDAEDGLKAATAAADAKEADIKRMDEAVGKHRYACTRIIEQSICIINITCFFMPEARSVPASCR